MSSLDAYVARALAGLTFPTDGAAGRRPHDPGDLVSSVCPMPALKCLALHTAPCPPAALAEAAAAAAGGGGVGGGNGGAPGGPLAKALRPPAWDGVVGELLTYLETLPGHFPDTSRTLPVWRRWASCSTACLATTCCTSPSSRSPRRPSR